MKFRRKATTVEAVSVKDLIWNAGHNWNGLPDWIREIYESQNLGNCVVFAPDSVSIETPDAELRAVPGDWIVRTSDGKLSRYGTEAFHLMFEEASSE